MLLAFVGIGVGVAGYVITHYVNQVERVTDAFPSGPRPATAAATTGESLPLTFLLIGIDSTVGNDDGAAAGSISLVRFDGDRRHAQVIALPSDLSLAGPDGGGETLDSQYRSAGPAGLVQSIETVSNIRVNDVAIVDFAGFETVTDALGGITVDVPGEVTTARGTFSAGEQQLDGAQALGYASTDIGASSGGQAAIRRQQQVLSAMFATALERNLLTDVPTLMVTVSAVSSALQIDDTLSDTDVVSLAYDLRGVTPSGISYLTVPLAGSGTESGEVVQYLDTARAGTLWQYLAADELTQHAGEFG